MTCEERRDLILLDAMGALDVPDREALYAHLQQGCVQCEGYIAEARALLSMIPLSLDPQQPSEDLKTRLMARTKDRDVLASIGKSAAIENRRRWSWSQVFLGAAASAIITAGIFAQLLSVQHRRVAELREQLVGQEASLHYWQTAALEARDAVRFVASSSVRVVALTGTDIQPRAEARVFLDASQKRWRFYASNLKPPGGGRTYELWLISGNRKIPAGTFNIEAAGENGASGVIPAGVYPIAALAVTSEPAGGVPQPTGPIQLLGKL